MSFTFKKLQIPDVVIVTPNIFSDERGWFMEAYKRSDFEKNGISLKFVQDNHSKSAKGVLRGLHYQLNPNAQGKLVKVLKGRIFDVAVDIRKGSPFYGKWIGLELSDKSNQMLWIPHGFAHGFIAMEDETEILYKVTNEYSPEKDRGIIWNDPDVGIKWPIKNPILSEKDSQLPLMKNAENNFEYEGNI